MAARLVLDLATGATTLVALTPEEEALRQAEADAAALEEAARAEERQRFLDDVALLRQHHQRATSTNAQNTEAVKAQTRLLRRVFAELRD